MGVKMTGTDGKMLGIRGIGGKMTKIGQTLWGKGKNWFELVQNGRNLQ